VSGCPPYVVGMADERTDVAIAGAGPTGLVLALWLTRRGVGVRIFDKAPGPGTTSRALVIHARTLELYRQLGIADEVSRRSLTFAAANMWVRGEHVGRAVFDDIGRGLTPYPYILILPQDKHEALLAAALSRAGVEVERGTELVDFEPARDTVALRARRADRSEARLRARYLVGCDGAHSRVRERLGVGFPGGTYERLFYVADVIMRGPAANHELHVALDEADFLAVFPLAGEGAARIIGTVRREEEGAREAESERQLGWPDVSRQAAERMRLDVVRVNWFSTYRVHHRVARSFGRGRVFLAGDAAHIHSPVGGQGMNTGVGDAVNLAWKLAAVVGGGADPALLASYEPERIAFARRLVASTDRAFSFVTRDGALARRVRLGLVPRLLPGLVARPWFRSFMFRTLSQTAIEYRDSPISAGSAGRIYGGDRLPWVPAIGDAAADNFASLSSMDWQLHVYGAASPALRKTAATLGLALQVFRFTAHAAAAGLARNALYLVRPDGYVAFADRRASPLALVRYLNSARRRSPARSPSSPPVSPGERRSQPPARAAGRYAGRSR
jgi:2-polyprenyl-6-methoxyphenol hydroxylase-like FAD-dependent oxidoreductase